VLEAHTYRYRGHSVADAGLAYRSREEIAAHQASDPLIRERTRLLEAGIQQSRLEGIEQHALGEVAEAVRFAEQSPEPQLTRLAEGVYAPGSFEQFQRMRQGSAFGEEQLVFDAGLGR
ncbi:MAG: thiamine pyrophosphate-dependent enzyme, partial [Solirubrobacteraceae bacterium]